MNRYQISKQLGDGTYGSVLLATTVDTNERVAIKKMKKKYYSWDECLNLREVKSLRKLNHPNIVKLKEVVRENDMLYFVFEFMKENLYQMMKDRDKLLPESVVRNITYQVLQGLSFMHKFGFFHRDLKPENLLCNGTEQVKIADFGLAREIRSRPPYTDYVSTRWYRAPEVLLRSTNYSSPIDIWAVGCIMAELYTLRPLFPGSSEIDEIFKICSVLGTAKKEDWGEGYQLAAAMNFRFPQCVSTPLKQIIPNASNDGLQIIRDMLMWNPQKRPSALQCLRYGYFQVGTDFPRPPPVSKTPVNLPSQPSPSQKMAKPPSTYPNAYPEPKNNDFNLQPLTPRTAREDKSQILPALPVQMGKQNESDVFSMTISKKQSGGRKRWGAGLSDTWDDWADVDYPSNKTTKKVMPPPKTNNLFGKENLEDDGFMGPLLKKTVGNKPVIDSGKSSGSSAKQHYLSKSRYLPGINPKVSARRDSLRRESFGLGTDWSPLGKNLAMGEVNSNSRRLRGNNYDADYVPSFLGGKGGDGLGIASKFGSPAAYGGKSGAEVPVGNLKMYPDAVGAGYMRSGGGGGYQASFNQSGGGTGYQPSVAGGWKKAAPLPAVDTNKKPNGTGNYGPGQGRTDWTSKYLKS
uniref:non-specific serine/threonine protein kinase n=1 Tax=Arion vulgaris TaxID=1028688 RepID=A0A0B7AFF1_9EUPU